MDRNGHAHAAMLLATVLIATSFPVVASIAGAMDSAVLAVLRFALAALLFAPLVALRYPRAVVPDARSMLRYVALSAPLAGFFLAMFEALRTTTALNTGALMTFTPGFAALFSLLLLGERPSRRRTLALVAGMGGALWVVADGDLPALARARPVVGDAYFLAGTASLGLYSVLVKRLHRGEPMAVMTLWTLVGGTGWLLLLGGGAIATIRTTSLEPRVLVAVAYLALFTTLVTFFLTQVATTAIGATRTMSYTYLNPSFVALLGWGTGAVSFGWRPLPGILLTLAAMVQLQRDAAPALRGGAARVPAATTAAP